ncbi:MAG: FtsX-like permease family protein [Clostridia bacterium]|nr:FtsX-like permease family protein [Clostridia bacterium]
MQLVLNPVALLIAVAVCLVTTLISAYIPAKRAIRLNAIDSIRQSGDIKISRKKVRTSGLTQKLFGFEGMIASKNFKRNKKRYRSTVISLFLSIVLFISASSFSSYLNSLFAGVSSDESFVDIEYYTVPDSESDPAKVMSLLSGADGLTDSVFYSMISIEADFDKSSLDRSYPLDKISAAVLFVNDDRFEKLCRDNGIDPSACFDKSSPSAVVYNHEVLFTEIDGKSKRQNYTVLNESSFPAKGTFATPRQIDGFVLFSVGQDDNGDEIYTYYPADYMDSLETGNNGFSLDDLDQSKAKVLSAKEAETVSEINIAASLRECPFFIPSGSFTIFYPDSVKTAVLTEDRLSELYQTDYSFLSDSHSKTFSEMTQILKDNRMDNSRLRDVAADKESFRMIKTVLDVFSYGFIILISLISMANVFNTISTGISLRRREFAMLRSVGMSQKSFRRMMNYECIIYGLRSLLWGLPASVLVTYAIYKAVSITYLSGFYIPWYSIVIAVLSVFVVVFATMLYSTAKIRKENPIDALRTENL